MPKPSFPIAWYERAAEIMVRTGKTLRQAVGDLIEKGEKLSITSQECEDLESSKAFIQVLQLTRNRMYKEIADSPLRGKSVAVGQLSFLIDRLMEQKQWDKAGEVILKLAKVEGWVGAEAEVNVFAGLNAKDLKDIRAKLIKPNADDEGSSTATL